MMTLFSVAQDLINTNPHHHTAASSQSVASTKRASVVVTNVIANVRAMLMRLPVFAAFGMMLVLSACGGGGGNAGVPDNDNPANNVMQPVNANMPAAANIARLYIDRGPDGAPNIINALFADVTICRPGTNVCQTIDHVLVDTGSFGLRVMNSAINSNLGLPAVIAPNGAAAAECGEFVSGVTWGSVKRADVKIAGEVAASLPIQIIGDTDPAIATIPSGCARKGNNISSLTSFGANGVLGIGLFKEDCGQACANSIQLDKYYGCSLSGCRSTSMPLANQVANPVPSFSVNNNGVVVVLPNVPFGGASAVTGSLVFGIETQSNNTLTSTNLLKTNSVGNITTTYGGRAYTASFLDTGSNALFFNDSTIPTCNVSKGFYCPTQTLTLSAINTSPIDQQRNTVSFIVENVDQRNVNAVAMYATGQSSLSGLSSNSFNWGLPFFYGKRVFVAMDGRITSKGVGPFWAY
jgi:hypothetical protein